MWPTRARLSVVTASLYREYLPAPHLRARIACYWTLQITGPQPQNILPDGSMDLLFDVDCAEAPRVVGTMTRAFVSTFSRATVSLLGVRFRPGEAFALLDGTPARRLRDAFVPLREFWGSGATDLGEELSALPDSISRVRRLDAVLTKRGPARPADPRLRHAVRAIGAASGAVRVAGLATATGLGERHLERLFDERVGIGPKALARVLRVQGLLRRLDTGAPWASMASDLGWSDQAHLARDLRDLAGMTPTELARAVQMSDSSNPPHGPLRMLPP
jgi:AraC-like DNA-binding protein